ncbi:hypothetical protein [Parabacteroides johnsonii]|nr:hypothetical protein [Parabacteroides johnsonii]
MRIITKSSIIIVILLNAMICFAQSPFERGYKNGYIEGYMYAGTENGNITTITPIPPLPPLPTIRESTYNYQDGYNRGYIDGYKSFSSNYNNNASSYAGGKMLHRYPKYQAPDVNLLATILMTQARMGRSGNQSQKYYYNPRPSRQDIRCFIIDLSYVGGSLRGPHINMIATLPCIGEYLQLGFGVGFSYIYNWLPEYPIMMEESIDLYSVPLFLDIRSYFLKTRVSPFVSQKLGYAIMWEKDIFAPGIYSDSSVGIRCLTKKNRAINIAAGYTIQKTGEVQINRNARMDDWLMGWNVKLGFEL